MRKEFLTDPHGLSDVIGEYDATSTTRNNHGLGLVSRTTGHDTFYYDFDAVGSATGLTDIAGSLLNHYAYGPTGESIRSIHSLANPFRFIGQYGVFTDDHTTISMRARFYDVSSGRFISIDPIQLTSGDSNYYRYAENNGIDAIDPTGLAKWFAWMSQGAKEKQWFRIGKGNGFNLHAGNHKEHGPHLNFGRTHMYRDGIWDPMFGIDARIPYMSSRGNTLIGSFFFGMWLGGEIAEMLPDEFYDWLVSVPDGEGPGTPADEGKSNAVGGRDPNQKLPGSAVSEQSFVPASAVPYRIDFENYETAPAPAQVVTISDFLSADFDLDSFTFDEVGFGDIVIDVPANSQHYQTIRLMTYNNKTFDVLIELGFHSATGELYGSFQTIDPATQLPPDVLTGFLPPEDGTGRGKGNVTYTVRPKAGLTTGTQIRNVALISFDGQLAISTDQVDPLDPSKGIDLNKQVAGYH